MRTLKTILLLVCVVLFASCDNDDGNSPNNSTCTFAGLTYLDANGMIVSQLSDMSLITDFFPNALGNGVGQIEVNESGNLGNNFFFTNVVTLNSTGPAQLRINGTDFMGVTATCQRVGSAVGDEFRYDIQIPQTPQNAEAELCVTIDVVTP